MDSFRLLQKGVEIYFFDPKNIIPFLVTKRGQYYFLTRKKVTPRNYW